MIVAKSSSPMLSGVRPASIAVPQNEVNVPKAIERHDKDAGDTARSVLCNLVDSSIRAAGRHAEATADVISANPLIRLPFRFLTEVTRNGTSASLQGIFENKKITKAIWLDGAKKAFENTAATAFFEPNRFKNSFTRVGAGFANMLIRFGARFGLMVLEVISPEEMNLDIAPDEFVSRSLGRVIKPFSDSPIVGIGSRFVEQVLINFGVEKLFVKNHVLPKFKTKLENPTVSPKEA